MLEKSTCGYILHRLNPLLGTKLGFFLARSTFLPAHASFWPERSGATTSSLLALLSAVLLRRMNRWLRSRSMSVQSETP